MAVNTKPVVVGVSGASGSVMAKGTVDALLNRDVPVVLVCTAAGRALRHYFGYVEGIALFH